MIIFGLLTLLYTILISVATCRSDKELNINDRVDNVLGMINSLAKQSGQTMRYIESGELLARNKKGALDKMEYDEGYLVGLDSWKRMGHCKAVYSSNKTTINVIMPLGLRFLAAVFPVLRFEGHNISAYSRFYENSFDIAVSFNKRLDCFKLEKIEFHADDAILYASEPEFDGLDITRFFRNGVEDFVIDTKIFSESVNSFFRKFCPLIYVLPFDIGSLLDVFTVFLAANINEGLNIWH